MVRGGNILMLIILLSPVCLNAQALEFNEPEVLPYNINSDSHELMPLLSPRGRFLYFSRAQWHSNTGGEYAGQDIWVSERLESGWRRATNTDVRVNTKGNEAVAGINPAGNMLYVMRTSPNKKVKGIYFSKRSEGGWSMPQLIPIEGLESLGPVGFYMHPDGDVLLISMQTSEGLGAEDIYISTKDGNGVWSRARNIGVAINTPGSEISPFLTAGKDRLYFSSTGHEGLGDADIFVSDRLHNSWDTWSVPRNLGKKVNSTGFDAYFSIYGDTLAYFSSGRSGKLLDIYEVTLKKPVEEQIDRMYLSSEEVTRFLGDYSQPVLSFEKGVTVLSEKYKMELRRICSAFAAEEGVKIEIQAVKGTNGDLTEIYQKRLLNVLDFMRNNGINGSRITFGTELMEKGQDTGLAEETELVKIRFYR